jgi:polyphosphate kinase
MTRNIDHRVEALVPIQDPKIVRHICDDILAIYFADAAKIPADAGERRVRAQKAG